jgi:hypothetical protein
MLIFSISFPDLTLWYTWKKGLGWKEAQRQGDFTNNFSIYTYTPQNIYTGLCKCIWQMFKLALCRRKEHIYRLQQDKCKRKSFTLIGDLHAVYTAIDTYTHKTVLNQWWVVLTRWLKTNGSFQSSSSENWQWESPWDLNWRFSLEVRIA